MLKIKQYLIPFGGKLSTEIFSGLTVALALIPEAIAFALVAHVQPQVGLYAAFFMCLITALFGGRPGMISGATGAMAVVIVSLVSKHGLDYLFATIILTGALQILIGVSGLAKFIKMMPKSVMIGFVNGLAIVIFIAQLNQFKEKIGPEQYTWLQGEALLVMIGLVILAMLITHYLPKFIKAIPSALIAIITIALIVHLAPLDVRTVKDMLDGSTISGGFPSIYIPHIALNWNTVTIILPYAVILCVIALSESLMTLSLIDEMTQTRGKGNKECIAQGVGNIVSGLFKSMGGCAMIGQSMINISSGAIGRLSGIAAGIFLLIFLLIGWPIIQQIPLAALVGVMFMVVYGTFEWTTFNLLKKIPKHDALVIITVTTITVFANLAIAVIAGIVMASLVFAWETAKHIRTETKILESGTKIYTLHGPLFFGSTTNFNSLFTIKKDPNDIIIDFKYSRVADHSAIQAITSITDKYLSAGKKIHLKHLSPKCIELLNKAKDLVEVNIFEDQDYPVV
ncbi:SulP family inorganic anion transporter [Gammaproteobacteria bacterium]|nr:SulP family inorganic anion transporter [Gammaproteobacteria bacterium]